MNRTNTRTLSCTLQEFYYDTTTNCETCPKTRTNPKVCKSIRNVPGAPRVPHQICYACPVVYVPRESGYVGPPERL